MKIKAFKRPDGQYGIRNKIMILSTVGCANETARRIADQVAGAVYVPNAKGCGQIGESLQIMWRSLVGLALNPNVFGTLIVGLGCETIQPHVLYRKIRESSRKPLAVLTIQEEGGTVRTVAKGVKIAQRLAEARAAVQREPADLGALVLATNCGGSDATSGLSANPVLGACSDRLIRSGGTVLLGETTEMIGTEQILARRAANETVRKRLLHIIQGLEAQFQQMHIDIRGSNPTPGNIRGGLSTLEEKALGSIEKGGTSTIRAVVRYGERPESHGLVLMDTPGYDIESVTGMAAGGAQLCVFTTGRGTPIGNPILPILKMTGNRRTYQRMQDNIDIDASAVLRGEQTIASCGDLLLNRLIAVCNGEQTKAEQLGFSEISIYHSNEVWCCDL